jgi:hypothetical protein
LAAITVRRIALSSSDLLPFYQLQAPHDLVTQAPLPFDSEPWRRAGAFSAACRKYFIEACDPLNVKAAHHSKIAHGHHLHAAEHHEHASKKHADEHS